MRKGGRIDLIISIVLALTIWAYVVGVVDPTTQGRVNSVPIEIENEALLNERGLEIDRTNHEHLVITIRGDRSDVKKVKASDINVTMDVGELEEGKNEVAIAVSVPATVTYVRADVDKVAVYVKETKSDDEEEKAHSDEGE